MKLLYSDIEIVSVPSILGLKPTGVENLPESLLKNGLQEKLGSKHPVVHVPSLNHLYSSVRDKETNCLNAKAIKESSLAIEGILSKVLNKKHFALVLGGDCSILIGIMVALKSHYNAGLIFFDAHADFYEPEKSITGEVADMDLAIVTGRGPKILADIHDLRPYVKDENVIHIGQRDWEETQKYGSQDIRDTEIQVFDNSFVEKNGTEKTSDLILEAVSWRKIGGYWIHFDTDVLSDEINPAVDYKLPGGLSFEQMEHMMNKLLLTGKMIGMSLTIFNPNLDKNGAIAKNLSASIGRIFNPKVN